MSDGTAKLTWRAFRLMARKNPRLLTYAGPTAILLIIMSWAGLTWFGFALIYFPQLPKGFDFTQVPGGSSHSGIVESMSLSVGALMGRVHAAQAQIDRRQHEARALAVLSQSKAVAAK